MCKAFCPLSVCEFKILIPALAKMESASPLPKYAANQNALTPSYSSFLSMLMVLFLTIISMHSSAPWQAAS